MLEWEVLFLMATRAFPHTEYVLREAPDHGASLIMQEPFGWRITWQVSNLQTNQYRENGLKPITQYVKDLLAAMPVYVPLQMYLPDPQVGLREELLAINKRLNQYREEQRPESTPLLTALTNRFISGLNVLHNLPSRWISDRPLEVIIDEASRIDPDLCHWLYAVGGYVSWTKGNQLITQLDINTIAKAELEDLVSIYGIEHIESGLESLTRVLASAADRYQPDVW